MIKLFYKLYYYLLFILKDPKKVIRHPRYDLPIKFGFTVGKRHFYRLEHDYDIFENRFRYLKTFYQEVENKLTAKDIAEFCDAKNEYIENYQKSIAKGSPEPKHLDAAKQLNDEMKYRAEWLFEPTSLYKYASVIYFDLQEDIKDYDVQYNNEKIVFWSKKKTLLKLLLKELMSGVESLLHLSSEDFNHYTSVLQKSREKQRKLISDSGLTSNKKQTEATI